MFLAVTVALGSETAPLNPFNQAHSMSYMINHLNQG